MAKKKNTTLEITPSKTKEEIIKEAKRIEESVLYSAKKHFVTADFWQIFHFILGVPIVVLSAIVGLSIFSQFDGDKTLTGVLTLVITGLSSLMTFFNPNDKASSNKNCGNSYDALCNKVRIFRTIDCWREKSEDVLTEKLKHFSEQKDRLNQDAPQVPWFAYPLAKRGIEKGEASFVADIEKPDGVIK